MSEKPKVALDLRLPDFLEALFMPHCELVAWPDDGVLDDDIAALLTYAHPPVDAAMLARLPHCKVVSNYGVGVDHIVVADCVAAGIPVGNTPGAVNGATADLSMALLLAAARNIVIGDKFARGAQFTHVDPGILLGRDVFGATLGIVGMGAVGREVAKRALAFDMQVLYHNRRRNEEAEADLGVVYAALDALLQSADFVTLNVPLNDSTKHMISARELSLMRSTAYLVNTARGGVVDTQALFEVLRDGGIAGAALDVTEPEPLPRDHPLLALDNLTLLPHLGTSTYDTRARMGQMALANLLAGLAGQPLEYEVTAN
ncbi:MAG: D-glycerate dehydrogenase [Gammaproteobacteria bacterium]|nr:D-glycerate dehydrogenase [Gammaproteobacteria bacterium]